MRQPVGAGNTHGPAQVHTHLHNGLLAAPHGDIIRHSGLLHKGGFCCCVSVSVFRIRTCFLRCVGAILHSVFVFRPAPGGARPRAVAVGNGNARPVGDGRGKGDGRRMDAVRRNLNPEQMKALRKGEAGYTRSMSQTELEKAAEFLENAFASLAPYIGEVSDKYYRLLFARTVQCMQDLGVSDTSKRAVSTKINIFMELLEEYRHPAEDASYEALLTAMYEDLGYIRLDGKELPRDDNAAHLMFDIARRRGSEPAKDMLDSFRLNADGVWQFTG